MLNSSAMQCCIYQTAARAVESRKKHHSELFGFLALVLCLNIGLLAGKPFESLMFDASAVSAGEWWRVLLHPFVHVTWYHLLLDASAFFLLYSSLLERQLWARLGYVWGAGAGSLFLSWLGPSANSGLCGLSGIAHGLMAVSALELITSSKLGSPERRVGMVSLVFLLSKATYEAVTGHMFFSFLAFGMVGSPVAVSHLGGIIGTLLVYAATCALRVSRVGDFPIWRRTCRRASAGQFPRQRQWFDCSNSSSPARRV